MADHVVVQRDGFDLRLCRIFSQAIQFQHLARSVYEKNAKLQLYVVARQYLLCGDFKLYLFDNIGHADGVHDVEIPLQEQKSHDEDDAFIRYFPEFYEHDGALCYHDPAAFIQ